MLDAIKLWEIPDYLIVIFFVLVILWEAYRWTKEKKRARRLAVQTIAFKTEFQVYRDIWKAIVSLQGLAPITPSVDSLPLEVEEQKKLYKQRINAALKAFQTSETIVELSKPFYCSNIHSVARKLNRDCFKHLRKISRRLEKDKIEECYDMADKLQDDTKHIIKEMEQAIRKEIS